MKTYLKMLLPLAVVMAFAATAYAGQAAEGVTVNISQGRWNPYVVGAGIGCISFLAFLFSGQGLGASSAYMRTGGMLEKGLEGKVAMDKEYYRKHPARITWQWMLIVGVLIGALGSSLLSGSFQWEWTPAMWTAKFSGNFLLRWLAAFVGGGMIGFGARLAGGCTSGHGITGTLQLNTSSWVALLCFFAGGSAVALGLY